MYGAIIGDLAGSIYEYDQTKSIKPIYKDKIIEDNSFFSDDTILTVAIADCILNNGEYGKYLKEYTKRYINYHPDFYPYFKSSFSPSFIKWANGENEGNSIGNGALMRISSVGYLFNTKEEVLNNAYLATIPSHNSSEAISYAKLIAMIIFLSRSGYIRGEIINALDIKLQYKPFERFNTTCSQTIDNCLYALFTSNSFEESILKVISYGGDTDTNACIVGSMAESLYGIDDKLINEVKNRIPYELSSVIDKSYQKVRKLV